MHIEKTSIGNFTQDTSSCIHLDTARAVQVFVVDSFLRECRNGVSINGSGPTNAERPSVEIDNTRIEQGLNTESSGRIGVYLQGNVAASIRNSALVNFGDGIFAFNNIASTLARVNVVNTLLTQNTYAAIETGGANITSLGINVSNSQVHQNNAVLIHRFGFVNLSGNTMTTNSFSLWNCGSGAVQTIGNNMITSNSDTGTPANCVSGTVISVTNVGAK